MGSSLFSSRSSQLPLHSQQLTLPPLLVVCTVPLVLNPPPHLLHPLPLPLLPPLPPFRTLPSSLPSVSALLRWLIVMNMLVSPNCCDEGAQYGFCDGTHLNSLPA